jgi:sepiapterin reductase
MSFLLVVSGASRGFGQAVAVAFARSFFDSVHSSSRHSNDDNDDETRTATDDVLPQHQVRIILTGRDEFGLRETKERIIAPILSNGDDNDDETPTSASSSTDISIHPMDLSDMDTLDQHMDELIGAAKPLDRYERIVIINNAGSLGPLGKVANIKSLQEFSQAIQLNVTSSLWFTTRWVKELLTLSEQDVGLTDNNPKQAHVTPCTIVNISSLCAIEPFPTMSTYCAGKAARDMFHQSLAKEEEECHNGALKVLNYAPGAMDTDMTVKLREEDQLDTGLKEYYRKSHDKGELIHPNTSASKLVRLVLSGDFTTGTHVDYWDLPDI